MFFPSLTLDWGLAIDPIELSWIDLALERIAAHRRAEARRTARKASAPVSAGASSRTRATAGHGG
jgi:hypothetical protein